MSYDGIFTRVMKQELEELLVGGKVNKIDQPYKNECVLTIRNQGENFPLLLSAHPQYARIHLSQQNYKNPLQPPQFVMVMRKHLNRAILNKISQLDNDRILIFHFNNRDELGDQNELLVVCEIMGRHSNVILVNEKDDKILEVIRHVPQDQNSYRTLLPGASFKPAPQQDKLDPFSANDHQLIQALLDSNRDGLAQKILDQYQGFGKESAQELASSSKNQPQHVPAVLHNWEKMIQGGSFEGHIYQDQSKEYFTPFPYQIFDDLDHQRFESLSECLDRYYADKAKRDRIHQMSSQLIHLVDNELNKNRKKLAKQEKEMDGTKKADQFRIKGEVLTAYMHLVEAGMNEIELANFYDDEKPITISLDPQLSPAANAQKLFDRYQKLKNRKVHLESQIKQTKEEIDYLESVKIQLELADYDDIEDIREELISQSYIKKNKKQKKKNSQKAKPHHYHTSAGIDVLVGRNNKQNDQLSMKKAHKNHYWFHTKDIPGSHVILQTNQPSEEDIIEAAEIAAYHSKAQQSSNVAVDYVQVKHVHKPKGAKPGFVIYEDQQTAFVTPVKKEIALRKVSE